LLLHRSAIETDPDLWGIPAGKVESGESDLEAAVREIYEETGIKADPADLEYLGLLPIEYDTFTVEFPIFHLKFDERPEIILDPEEHIGNEWLTPGEILQLPNLMKDVDVIIEKYAIEKLGINE
jgi:8-oxo-dGTP pyrophosphatase MutT (NUDIX family)